MNSEDVLYHYTSAAGLIGLLGNPSQSPALWLTQIQYMNDDAESYHAVELARVEIMNASDTCPGVRRVSSGCWGIPYEGEPAMLFSAKDWGIQNYYSFSLTEQPDLLSQWRGYAPQGGYCVGFRFGDLQRLAAQYGFQLKRCIYDDEAKRLKIVEAMHAIEAALDRNEVDLSIDHMSSLEVSTRAEATARVRIQQVINPLAPYFKHSSFEEEREWRIVGLVSPLDAKARWRPRGSDIIPYCEFDIGPSGPCPLNAVEVVVGPGLDYQLVKYAIDGMNFGKSEKPKISQSGSTWRG